MQLILLQKVTNLGNLGDKVNVKPGYGRNFLVPQGKAVPATAANLAEFEAKRAEYEAKAAATLDAATARQAKLADASVTVAANANAGTARSAQPLADAQLEREAIAWYEAASLAFGLERYLDEDADAAAEHASAH